MLTIAALANIALHALIAWMLVEIFVNNAHRLNRRSYIFFHYVSVVSAFAFVFFDHFKNFSVYSVFATTMIVMVCVLTLEVVVFKFLYSGDRWFLNYVDWIVPMFLAMSTVYFVGTIV